MGLGHLCRPISPCLNKKASTALTIESGARKPPLLTIIALQEENDEIVLGKIEAHATSRCDIINRE
jgi:hypothetical protein